MGVTVHLQQVRHLFDEHAAGWSAKYEPGAPLEARLARFAVPLASLAPPPAVVLDLGCGTGNLARHLAASKYHVIGADLSSAMLDVARRSADAQCVEWVQLDCDGFALPCPQESCDAVVASSMLEYVDDPARVMRECARVLRPGGVMLCTVPDAAAPIRRAEAVARSILFTFRSVLPSMWPRRLRAYHEYLRLSKNRFSLARWRTLARDADLEHHELQEGDRHPALALLAFRRAVRPKTGA